jgi:site-specific DNA recombinase
MYYVCMNPHQFILFLRKSTDRDDTQAQSIESQRHICETYAHQHGLRIVGIIEERESAKTPGRREFGNMLKRIQNREADGILAYHPDRLARNSKDGGEIIYLLDTGEIKDLQFPTFWFENTPQGKFMLGMEFVQSKRYTDNLSIVTKRGLLEKCRNGVYPSIAPRGYLNDVRTKTIVVDPEVAPVLKRMFALYAEGESTLDDLQRFLTETGVISHKTRRHPGGKPLHIDLIRSMLRNPFYYGDFCYSGEIYKGTHKPLISKELYDTIQRVYELRSHKISKRPNEKTFTKLIKCGTCGMSICAETQKGHIYYRCTKKSKAIRCEQPFIREEELERQLSLLLFQFSFSDAEANELIVMLERERLELETSCRTILVEKRDALGKVQEGLKRLMDLYVGQIINRDEFMQQQVSLHNERVNLQKQISETESRRGFWLEPMRTFIKTAQNARFVAESGTKHDKKRLAVEIFGSNLLLDQKNLAGMALKPWNLAQENRSQRKMVPRHGLEP